MMSPLAAVLDRFYALLPGGAAGRPVDFASLTRRLTRNDALACPEGFCPRAIPDVVPPVFPLPADRLRQVLTEVALADAGTERLPSLGDQDRYLARTPFLRFPDPIDVRVIDIGDGRSTLAMYSRSRLGLSDLGVNRRRLQRWLAALDDRVAAETSIA